MLRFNFQKRLLGVGLPAFGFVVFVNFQLVAAFGSPKLQEQEKQDEQETIVEQEVLSFEIQVKDADGNPVAEATVTPWALACSLGHGRWSAKLTGGIEPVAVKTDSRGIAKVEYPKYAKLEEQVSTTTVSVSVEHPDHPFVSSEHVDFPLSEVHQFQFAAGVPLEINPLINGKVDTSEVRVLSTSGRPGGSNPSVTEEGAFRLPPMPEGKGQLLLVKLKDKTATHFSAIVDLEIDSSKELISREIELEPAVSISGKLSENVPRPVKNGRIKVWNISSGKSGNEIIWRSWTKVNENGSFQIDGWPAGEPIQLIALCDGFFAKPGEKPPMVSDERAQSGFLRAQVFMDPSDSEIIVEMIPLVSCNFEVKDAFGKPVEGVNINSNPNIGWWNNGSQIYCYPLVNSVEVLITGKYDSGKKEGLFAYPFETKSDEKGRASMQLPVGRFMLHASNDKYQLPIKVGRRYERIDVSGDSIKKTLVVQPKGLELLGEWEDLCGLVFG